MRRAFVRRDPKHGDAEDHGWSLVRFEEHQGAIEEPSNEAWLISHERGGVPYLSVARVSDGYLLRSHDFADFVINEDGSTIDIFPVAPVDEEELRQVLEQQILPGVHQLRGAPAVHASAVSTPVGAVAFLGPSGAGKSTLAAFLARRYQLIADDYLPLRIEGGEVLAMPTSPRVRVRSDTLEYLGEQGGEAAGKIAISRPSEESPKVLRCMYVLGTVASGQSAPSASTNRETLSQAVLIDELSRKDSLLILASQLHRIDTKDVGLLAGELDFIEAITARVPIKRLHYPRAFGTLADVERTILGDLSLPTDGDEPVIEQGH